jgi:hypothetical protein
MVFSALDASVSFVFMMDAMASVRYGLCRRHEVASVVRRAPRAWECGARAVRAFMSV